MMCYHPWMVRTQIQLSEEQHRRLKTIARQRGLSLAELIRRLIEHGLGGEALDRKRLYERASHLVGAFRSDVGDLAAHHDRHLGDAFA